MPPPGWSPPPGWQPPASWPAPPPGWSFTGLAPGIVEERYEPTPSPVAEPAEGPSERRGLRREATFVMLAFLVPGVTTAIVVLVRRIAEGGSYAVFPTLVHHDPVLNLVLGILSYLPVAAIVPLALFLLARSGQPPRSLGIGWPSILDDLGPGLGLAAAAFGVEFVVALCIRPLLSSHRTVNAVSVGHVPGYYLAWGLVISFVTAVTEEVLVNGYLLTRLQQLGWHPWTALALSLTLRTTYHIYYGLGFLLTIPFGYLVTRSFQRHRRLNRAIAAHFLYDASIFAIAIFAH